MDKSNQIEIQLAEDTKWKVLKSKCERPGCGKEYSENENKEGECLYHIGKALFHEGQKGWTCCSKRVLTFDDFMLIPGCTSGKHSAHREVSQTHREDRKADVKLVSASDNGVEVYKSPTSTPVVSTPPPLKKEEPKEIVEELDPPNAVIATGKACLHRGCDKTFVDDSSRTQSCVFHPGLPIFHETLKRWSCCGAKAMEFEDFLAIEGCSTGVHKFVEKIDPNEQVQCRNEWYQMAGTVVVSIYAKKVKKDESKIEFDVSTLKVYLMFEDGKKFSKTFQLAEPINPSKSQIEFLSTKVEITLSKATGKQWTDLERK